MQMISSPSEPMLMGSPLSPAHGGGVHSNVQSPYLPSFLMGDPHSTASSPATRLWAGGVPNMSPSKAGSTSFSKGMPSSSALQPAGSAYSQSPRVDPRQRDGLPGRPKEKGSGPPTQGLLEAMNSPMTHLQESRHALDNSRLNMSTTSRLNQSQFGTPGLPGTPGMPASALQNSSHVFNQSINNHTLHSPAQIDPFFTQGDNIKSTDQLDETWVTVFGFPPPATSFILQQFSQYGNIIKHVVANDGNWMHIHYQSKLQAKKALSKNGKIYGNSIMIGVTQCIDMETMATHGCNLDNSIMQQSMSGGLPGTPAGVGTPGCLNQSALDRSTLNSSRTTSIRPLTAAFKAATNEQQVVQSGSTPQKNNGVVSKAMEYMFGW